jgi:2,4-dienoyl-CoA reductase-like NADH-dependent reductase (Old Yellow Enzyme family)/thioredoxin reductase
MEKIVRLFTPGRIGTMEIKNRIAFAPLGHGFTFGTKPDGFLTERLLAFYEARARGGAGLIQLTVASLGRPYASQLIFGPGVLGMMTDDHIPGCRRFVRAIHTHGTKISFSLGHQGATLAGPIQQRPPMEYPELLRVIAPSASRDPQTGFWTQEINKDDIAGLLEAFAKAALRGKASGFDAARIHAGHGYLLHQFLSPRTNRRKDEYGGSLENMARFPCEVVRRVRKELGPDFPIMMRMNGDDYLHGGITLEMAKEYAPMLVEAGIDGFSISSGPFETHHKQFPGMYQSSGALVPLAEAIKKTVKVPVIAVGKINAVLGERILQEGKADFIEMCRPLMADPDLPNKARDGRLEDIRPCIFCGHCQAAREGAVYASCTVNMEIGKELDQKPGPAARKRKVMVIGGGPAGMEAAYTLAERGHDVSLCEKEPALGGQWKLVSNFLPEEMELINYLSSAMRKAGVKVYLNQEVNAQTVEKIKPEVVLAALGSSSTSLNVPGIDGKNVVQATDVLAGKVKVGKTVVIIGGRLVGLTTALFLARSCERVSVVTRSKIGRGLMHNSKLVLQELLLEKDVRLFPNSTPESVTPEGVNCWWDSGEPPDKDPVFFFLKADTIVLAAGAVNNSRLADLISSIVPETYKIGDCSGKRSIFAAMREAYEVALKI